MKRTEKNFVAITIIALVAIVSLTTTVIANEQDELKCRNKKQAIENLIEGIKSNNTGLMKSSVYFAGKYRVKNSVPALIERLKTATDSNCKVLIALSLYMIGDEKGIDAIYNLSKSEKNERARRMFNAICIEYAKLKGSTILVADSGIE